MKKLLLALALLFSSQAHAADQTVASMNAASALTGAELLYCVQSAANAKCTVSQIGTYFQTLTFPAANLSAGAIPSSATVNNANWSGTVLSVANGGTGTSTPSLVQGSNVTISGSWPNQTISAMVPSFAVASDVQAGTNSTLVVSPSALSGSAAFQALTDGSTISWNVASGYNATLTLTGNTHTLSNPTNVIAGITYVVIINPSTFTGFAFGTAYDFGGSGTPTLTASKDNVVSCIAKATSGANSLYCTASLGF